MPDKENERLLGGAIDEKLLEEFDVKFYSSIRPKPNKKKLMIAFAKWFINLTDEERNAFYKFADEGINLKQWITGLIHEYHQSAEGVVDEADASLRRQSKKKRTRQARQIKQN